MHFIELHQNHFNIVLYKQGEVVLKRAGLTDLKTKLDTKLVAAK